MNKANYEKYLTTPAWRARRNRALKRAGFQCSRCGRRRQLHVHHRSYDRVGNEDDADLEVLCEDCHSGHHIAEMDAGDRSRLYLKLASEALMRDAFADLGDLSERVKQRCVDLQIDYDHAAIDRALELLSATKRVRGPKQTVEDFKQASVEGRPLTHDEAREFLARLGLTGLIKTVSPSMGTIDIYAPPPEDPDEFAYEVFW